MEFFPCSYSTQINTTKYKNALTILSYTSLRLFSNINSGNKCVLYK